MKKIILLLMLPFLSSTLLAQHKEDAEKLVEEGIVFHDKGDYLEAIAKYDQALKLDTNNLYGLAEKAFSLLSLQKYSEANQFCTKAIEKHPGEKGLKTVYVTYGNSLDGLKKTDEAIKIYDEGIKQFPDYYQLHFNKGITLFNVKKYEEAILCFQKSILLNPEHASSHNAIARLLDIGNKRIPSILAYCRFLSIEPISNRAKGNLSNLQRIMRGNVEETGKKSITINIGQDMLADTLENGKPKENSFASTDLILAMDAALDYDKKNKKKTEVEQFIRKLETVCSMLKETRKDNFGFYWDYYVPYFTEMKDKNLIETFAYIAFSSSEDQDVSKWIKSHKDEIGQFYSWSQSFQWQPN